MKLGLSLRPSYLDQVVIIFNKLIVFRKIGIHSFLGPYYSRDDRSHISLGLATNTVCHLGLRLTSFIRHNLIFAIVLKSGGWTSGLYLEVLRQRWLFLNHLNGLQNAL